MLLASDACFTESRMRHLVLNVYTDGHILLDELVQSVFANVSKTIMPEMQ